MDSINSFEPVITEQAKIIVLGTIPGAQSLEKQKLVLVMATAPRF